MHSRIKAVRKFLGLSQSAFGAVFGASRDMINNIENGRAAISDMALLAICREFNVDEIWLRTGEGEMFLPLSRDDEIAAYIAKVLSDKGAVFQRKLLLILSRLSPECLAELEKVADDILSGTYGEEKEQEV